MMGGCTAGQLQSCREEGNPSAVLGDGWATCFSQSQKSSKFEAVQGDYRDPHPSTLAVKRVSFKVRVSQF